MRKPSHDWLQALHERQYKLYTKGDTNVYHYWYLRVPPMVLPCTTTGTRQENRMLRTFELDAFGRGAGCFRPRGPVVFVRGTGCFRPRGRLLQRPRFHSVFRSLLPASLCRAIPCEFDLSFQREMRFFLKNEPLCHHFQRNEPPSNT